MLVTRSVKRAAVEVDRMVRRHAGAEKNTPIVFIEGSRSAPVLKGSWGYYTTPGGAPVSYPNAYRRAYGKPVYHASTMRVEVGSLWVCLRLARIPAERTCKPSLARRCGLRESTPAGIVRDRAIELGLVG